MMKIFSYECELMPHPWRHGTWNTHFLDAAEWVFEQTNGAFSFGHGVGNYYVHFADPKDRVLYKMFWSDQI
jgi:hypothetical protein